MEKLTMRLVAILATVITSLFGLLTYEIHKSREEFAEARKEITEARKELTQLNIKIAVVISHIQRFDKDMYEVKSQLLGRLNGPMLLSTPEPLEFPK